MLVPIRIRFSRKCKRCGLRYPRREASCIHCNNLSDRELADLKARIREEKTAHGRLGLLFLYIAGLIVIGLAMLTLF